MKELALWPLCSLFKLKLYFKSKSWLGSNQPTHNLKLKSTESAKDFLSNCSLSSGAIYLNFFTVWLSISLSYCVKFLWHLDVEKLRYRAKNDSTFVVSVEKWASNKERTSSFVLNIYRNSSNDEKSLWRRLSIP